ncbi:MAG: enoyl-CoA hydratase/isomerase family protein, partial [Chloroflexi bacterium]|nr:enoyl-CoA hydratase/isomerase family protein [Chloroflexota bacterium]
MSDDQQLIIEERDQIAFVTFNRPEKLNAWSFEMSNELREYLWGLNEGEYRIRCVVMTGSGRAFCSGADVGNLAARQGGEGGARRAPPPRAAPPAARRRGNAPVIAALNGDPRGRGHG